VFDIPDSSSTSSLSDVDSIILEQETREFARMRVEDTLAGMPWNRQESDIPAIENEYFDETRLFGRHLRPRTAVQQHPYTTEHEKYRQQIRRSGMKPVQVLNRTQELGQSYQEEDGEFSVGGASQESQRPRNLDSSSPNIQSVTRRRPNLAGTPSISEPALTSPSSIDGEGTVDIEALRRARKRRRIEESRGKSLKTSMDLLRTSYNDNIHLSDTESTRNDPVVFDFPESPPQTHRRGVFRPPPPLPSFMNGPSTKHVSSNQRLSPENESENEQEMSPMRHKQSRSTQKRRIGDSSEEESYSDEGVDVRRAGRRLVGVLPRSWVKLDMEKQRQRDQETRQKESPKRHNPPDRSVRGIARVKTIVQQHARSPIHKGLALLMNEEFAGTEGSPTPEPPQISLPISVEIEDLSSDPGSDMENDVIDWMAPPNRSNQRSKSTSSRNRKIQRRLNEFFPGRKVHQLRETKTSSVRSLNATASYDAHRNRHKHPRKRYKQQRLSYVHRAPSIGILDFPEEDMRYDSEIPSFLRIARRQARHNTNFGRQSPTKKYIRLPTREDTSEANDVLTRWRRGELGPKELVARNNTTPTVTGRPLITQQHANGANVAKRNEFRPLRAQIIARSNNNDNLKESGLLNVKSKSPPNKGKPKKPQAAVSGFRTAQLESLESDFSTRNRKLAFENSLRNAENNYAIRRLMPRALGSEVARYLGKDENEAGAKSITKSIESTEAIVVKRKKRIRKGIAKHLEVRNPEFQQVEVEVPEPVIIISDNEQVQSLSGFATNYPDDFDIFPLLHDPASHFNSNTFIGGELFNEAIHINERDLDKPNGEAQVMLGGVYHLWSAWNDQMANDVQTAFQRYCLLFEGISTPPTPEIQIQEHLASIEAFSAELEGILKAFAKVLYFFDPVDRFTFTSQMCDYLESLIRAINGCLSPTMREAYPNTMFRALLRFLALQLCLTAQVKLIDGIQTSDRVCSLLIQCAESITQLLIQQGLTDARGSLARNNDIIEREIGFGKDDYAVEAVVILHHILEQANIPNESIWTVMNRHFVLRVNQANRISSIEVVWRDLFTMLPILEIDMTGIARLGRRFEKTQEDWTTVRAILDKVFDSYDKQTERTRASNVYIRTLLRRCYRLVQGWGWSQCESTVISIFDFFGRHKFEPLFNEETRGSPKFLEMLNDNPVMDLSNGDTAFHIFLKILALTLRVMSSRSAEKKVKGLIVRCMPNHNRQYLKEDDMRTVDLEALRNQHDLLCTLFWGSTIDLRRRILDSIRGMVNHRLAHRLACQLSVKSWTNLIRYVLSTADNIELLDEFSSWIQDVIHQGVSQYHLARTEIDAQCDSNPKFGNSRDFERVIQRNQSEVLNSLGDAVFGLKIAMSNTQNQGQVVHILESCGIEKLLLFSDDTSQHALNLLLNTLDVYRKFLDLPGEQRVTSQNKDESQDYGDWPEDYVSIDFIQRPIFQFLSNCFGSERAIPDALARSAIDTWVKILAINAERGEMDWSAAIDPYGEYAWDRLNDTDHKRKHTAYFYSAIIELDQSCLRNFEDKILSVWLVSLVERSSMLKFQHILTSKLLNLLPQHGLLQNLPFWKDNDETYHISLENIGSRRLSLLSSVFANMQSLYYNSIGELSGGETIKQQLITLLKDMMNAMKKNYLELRQGDRFSGAYVSFVQELIGYLHQYTVEICQVDRFFTQSSEFPLPEQDPAYVVGKLKGYGNRIGEQRTAHTVAHFLESLCERAILDGQTDCLISQLKRATDSTDGYDNTLTLRTLLLQTIFPVYMDNSLNNNTGWLLCLPIMPVISHLLRNSIYYMDSNSHESLSTTQGILMTSLSSIYQSMQTVLLDTQLLNMANILRILSLFFQTVSSALSSLDYIQRLAGCVSPARPFVQFFSEFSLFCAESLLDMDPISPVVHHTIEHPTKTSQFREYCSNSLKERLRYWQKDGEDYYLIQKSGVRRHVPPVIKSFEEEKTMLMDVIEEFHNILGRMSSLQIDR
jgi:Mus7/MMS22 family